MIEKITHKRSACIFLILSLISFGLTSYFIYHYRITTNKIIDTAYKNAHTKTIDASKALNHFISDLIPLAQSLANELSAKKLSKAEIEQKLQKKPIEVSGFNVTFVPHVYDENIDLYSPYYTEIDGEQKLIFVESLYDYTQPENTWYHKPLKEGAQFLEPYFGTTQETVFLEYAVPFFSPNDPEHKKPAGLVSADLTFEHLLHVLSTLYKGQQGYWFIITDKGTYVSHPKTELVRNQKTIFETAKKLNNTKLAKSIQKAIGGESVFIEYENEVTDAPSWLFLEPLKTPGLVLGGVFDKGELPLETGTLRREYSNVLLSAIAFAILFILFTLSLLPIRIVYLWIASFLISGFLAFGVIGLWYLTETYSDYRENLESIKDKKGLYEFVKKTEPQTVGKVKEKKENDESIGEASSELIKEKAGHLPKEQQQRLIAQFADPNYVPTGIYVNSVKFAGPNQIEVVCYIWQRYFNGVHDELSRGFILPQAANANITEIYRKQEKALEIIIWNVQTTLNQNFTYTKYPFDTKDLRIQIWHKDFEKKIILIPDLDSYTLINPRSLPGINPHLYIGGWQIEKTYFGYRTTNYNTLFGMYNYGPFGVYKQVDKSTTPELFFNIMTQRDLIDTLWSDLLPLAVIAALLFVILLTNVAQGWAILGSCASIFFGVVFAQSRFRTKIPAYELVYFENFFFVLYTAILLVVIVSLLYHLKFNIRVIQFCNNAIPKMLYWPLLFTTLLLITLAYLY